MLINKTLLGGAGAVAAVMVITVIALWNQNGNLRERIGKAEAAVTEAKQTNDSNLTAIADLSDDLDACVTQREVEETANEAVVSGLKSDILKLEQDRVEVRIQREEVFREPSCEELGNLDINAICPALASGLRESARSLDESRDPGEEGSSAHTVAKRLLRAAQNEPGRSHADRGLTESEGLRDLGGCAGCDHQALSPSE